MFRVVAFAALVLWMGVSPVQAGNAKGTMVVAITVESSCTLATTPGNRSTLRVTCGNPTAYRVEISNEPVSEQAVASGERSSGGTERVATVVF